MAKPKGLPKSGGRQKGTPNKTTAQVKDMVLTALGNVGGVAYLERQADENPQAFMTLIGKVIPLQVAGDPDNPIKSVTEIVIRGVRSD
jgi:hypothetical protein